MYTCFGYRTKGKCPPRFHLAFDGRGDRETAYRCVCFRVCCVPRVRDASVLAKQIKRRVRIQWATHKPGQPGELIPHIGATPPVASSSRVWLLVLGLPAWWLQALKEKYASVLLGYVTNRPAITDVSKHIKTWHQGPPQ